MDKWRWGKTCGHGKDRIDKNLLKEKDEEENLRYLIYLGAGPLADGTSGRSVCR